MSLPDTGQHKYLIAINPYMLNEESSLEKIASSITSHFPGKTNFNIELSRGNVSVSEEGQAMLNRALRAILDLLKLKNTDHTIEPEVYIDFENKVTKEVNGKPFPVFIISGS